MSRIGADEESEILIDFSLFNQALDAIHQKIK